MYQQTLALLAATVPFAFGLIRLVQTGSDARYLIVATASLLGAAAVMTRAQTRKAINVTVMVFAIATLAAVVAAMLLGTKLGLGILVVAAAFGFCFAAAGWWHIRANPTGR
jgi:hypothetical protein